MTVLVTALTGLIFTLVLRSMADTQTQKRKNTMYGLRLTTVLVLAGVLQFLYGVYAR